MVGCTQLLARVARSRNPYVDGVGAERIGFVKFALERRNRWGPVMKYFAAAGTHQVDDRIGVGLFPMDAVFHQGLANQTEFSKKGEGPVHR